MPVSVGRFSAAWARGPGFVLGAVMAAAMLSPGAVQAQASPSAYTTGYRYDVMGRQTGVISPDPDGAGVLKHAATRNSYDAAGRLIKVESGELASWQAESTVPLLWTGFTIYQTVETSYDGLDRKLTERVKGSDLVAVSLSQFSYDNLGRLECTAMRMNPAVYGALPASACTPGTEGTQGPDRIARNAYDAAGQLLQRREGVGTAVEGVEASYSYTANGKQDHVIDANGNRARFEYDGHDRLAKWFFPSVTRPASFNDATQASALATAGSLNAGDYEQYGYDANGNRISLRKRDGTVLTYQYDALNRMSVKLVPERAGLAATHSRDVYYSYDLRGLMTAARYDSTSGEGVTTSYDGFGRITASTLVMDGVSRALAYCHDRDGNRTRMAFPGASLNGCASGNWAGNVAYGYDGLDRPLTILRENTGTIAAYSYDAAARRSAFTGGITTSYGYEPSGRLATLTNNLAASSWNNQWSFAYNPASQITQTARSNDGFAWSAHYNVDRGYTANGLNQYTAAGTSAFTYDANGNLTSDGASSFTYDVENRLVSAAGAKTATLRYDPMGRLYEITGTGGTTRLLYDGDALIGEYDTAGTLLRRYVHGADARADDPIAWYEGTAFTAASERLMRPDWQGSIVLVADSTGSTIHAINRYDEYGIPQATNAGRFQYTGQAWLAELGMYYYKARIYSPTLGRFMQTDPIGYDDQVNLYAYVGNDPLNRVDPTGLQDMSAYYRGWEQVAADHGKTLPEFAEEMDRKSGAFEIGAAIVPVERVLGLARVAAPVVRLMRNAEHFKPVAAGMKALVERAAAVQSGLGRLAAGEGRITAGPGAKDAFRGAADAAKEYGGNASDYTKISVSEVTKAGDRVSIHAVRNEATGEIFEKKVIYGR